MKDYARFDKYLDDLSQDVRPQPVDDGHKYWATIGFRTMLAQIPEHERGQRRCLDVGCGEGFMEPVIAAEGYQWTGATIGQDGIDAIARGMNVQYADMTFLPVEDHYFDLIFARHVLEHSPFPVITLMEWRRICKGYLILIVPCPDYWEWYGRNHYAMANVVQLRWWLRRSGWHVMHESTLSTTDDEFLLMWRQTPHPQMGNPGPAARFPEDKTVEYRLLCKASLEVVE